MALSKIKCEQHPGYTSLLWITNDMEDLANHVGDNFSLKVGLVPCGYYFTQEFIDKINGSGAYGYIGCSGKDEDAKETRDNFEEKILTLDIECDCNVNLPIDWLSSLNFTLEVTKGGKGQKLEVLKVSPIRDSGSVTSYVYYYKKPGFDEAYQAMSKMMPYLSEEDFAKLRPHHYDDDDDINEDLIEKTKEYRGEDMLFKKQSFNCYAPGAITKYNVTLSILAVDIGKNKKILLDMLDVLSKYRF